MQALENLKVLDLSHLGPGALCAMFLADFGAEVINFCSQAQADHINAGRDAEDLWDFQGQMNLIHESMNRNKKSVILDLKAKEDREAFIELSKEADVILEDFRPGVVKRLGIDYYTISKVNPKIIYCSLSGYGQDGPYAGFAGHDINFIGMAGILDLIGEKDGPPIVPMYFLSDFAGASLHSLIGILIALVNRNLSGKGQYVDISFVDSVMTLLTPLIYASLNHGTILKRGETLYSGTYPGYAVYKCSDDKYITIGCFEPWLWENLCRTLCLEELIPYQADVKNEKVANAFKEAFVKKTSDEWFNILKEKNICVGKVYTLSEVFEDPQFIYRNIIKEVSDPIRGAVKHLSPTIKLSETPGRIKNAAPVPGEHTKEVLGKYKVK